MAEAKLREAVGVFHEEAALRAAVDALLIAGFDRSGLSLLADEQRVEAKLGHRWESVAELEDDLGVPRRHYAGIDSRIEGEAALVGGLVYVAAVAAVGLIVAAGGTAEQALIAAAIAGAIGALIGFALARAFERQHTRHLRQQLERGGLLLWVRTPEAKHERRALDILRTHGADHAHVHDMPDPTYALKGGESFELSFMKKLGL
jgi:hypothetical protein